MNVTRSRSRTIVGARLALDEVLLLDNTSQRRPGSLRGGCGYQACVRAQCGHPTEVVTRASNP
jgi:hypothetical protein